MNGFLGEFLGTMILVLLGDGVVAGVLLNRSKAQNAGWIAITTGWGFAVMSGMYTARANGAPGYVNPVGPVVGMILNAETPATAVPMIVGEFLGAFAGAVLVWLHYLPHWRETGDPVVKLAIFANSPAIRNLPANFLSEAVATFVLVFVGASIVEKVQDFKLFVAPLGGALVWGIGLSLGGPTGYAINPARDLSPRIAHAVLPIAGKGDSDWGYAWIPVLGPLIGGIAAALLLKAIGVKLS